jgi:ribosome maturation factor RimP
MGWATAHFSFQNAVFSGFCDVRLAELLEKTVPPMGFELVDWEIQPRSKLVRVFIDKPKGVDVEDCARVSSQLTHLFTVENIDYERLEVSSPGLDRPLKKLSDYERFAGEQAQINLHEMTDGARRWKGRIREVRRGPQGDVVVLETAAGMREFPFTAIDKARLVPTIEWRKK